MGLGTIVVVGWDAPSRTAVLTSRDDGQEGVPLAGQVPMRLFATWHYRIVEDGRPDRGPYRVTTDAYLYYLDGPNDQGIVDYHWHPYEEPVTPHVHVGPITFPAGWQVPEDGLVIPTDRIALEYVVRQAIVQFRAEPRHDDWAATLNRLEGKFNQYREW